MQKNDMGAIYDVLRRELIQLLMEQRSQGRFARVADGTPEARSLFLIDLTHSIADILVTAYPNEGATAYAAALADAEIIAGSVLDRGLPTSR